MISAALLDLLVCPETRTPVTVAPDTLLERVNRAVDAGSLRTRSGQPVSAPLTEALVREDGQLLFAVRDGIPIMLLDEAIPLDSLP